MKAHNGSYNSSHDGFFLEKNVAEGIATLTFNRPARKNALTFESYAALKALFDGLSNDLSIKVLILRGSHGNFCSGGDVHDIIGPLTKKTAPELEAFTQMTSELVRAMRACPQLIIGAIDGVCAGAGAMLALASDFRLATPEAKTAFLFVRVGLSGADMGACWLLPRMIGHGRAAELLYTGRAMSAQEGLHWGFFNNLYSAEELFQQAHLLATQLATGPSYALRMTKHMLNQAGSMTLDQALHAEASVQALCMQTQDFSRAYEAFVQKVPVIFEGN